MKESAIYQFIKFGLFANGRLGVNFFFVLSGFLITRLLVEEKNASNKIDVPKFWMRRVLRIWPLFFFCVFFGFVVFPFLKTLFGQVPNETAHVISYLLFVNNFDLLANGLPDASVLGVLWSIAIEEQFYAVWPLLLLLFPYRYFKQLFAGLFIAGMWFRATHFDPEAYEYHTLSCMIDLVIGASGCLLMGNAKFRKRIETAPKWIIGALYSAVFVVFLFRDEILLSTHMLYVFERPIVAVLFLSVILEQCFATHSLFKMENYKTVSWLGTISYGLYCLHFVAILIVTNLTKLLNFNSSLWQVLFLETGLALGLTIVLAHISYRYFEQPFLSLKKKFFVTN